MNETAKRILERELNQARQRLTWAADREEQARKALSDAEIATEAALRAVTELEEALGGD